MKYIRRYACEDIEDLLKGHYHLTSAMEHYVRNKSNCEYSIEMIIGDSHHEIVLTVLKFANNDNIS